MQPGYPPLLIFQFTIFSPFEVINRLKLHKKVSEASGVLKIWRLWRPPLPTDMDASELQQPNSAVDYNSRKKKNRCKCSLNPGVPEPRASWTRNLGSCIRSRDKKASVEEVSRNSTVACTPWLLWKWSLISYKTQKTKHEINTINGPITIKEIKL